MEATYLISRFKAMSPYVGYCTANLLIALAAMAA